MVDDDAQIRRVLQATLSSNGYDVIEAAKGVPPDTVDKLRKMLAFLDDMQEPDELRALLLESTHTDGRSERNLEPQCYTQPALNVSHRRHRAGNLRFEFGRLPLRQKE